MDTSTPLRQTQDLVRQLELHAQDFATWIVENHEQAGRTERDHYNFTFEFESPDSDLYPDLTCKFWIGNDAKWLHLEVNEMILNLEDDNFKTELWEQLEELARETPTTRSDQLTAPPAQGQLNMDWTKYTKKQLEELPIEREFTRNPTKYDSLLFFPTRRKHESGYTYMCVVGVVEDKPVAVLGYHDDLGLPSFVPTSTSFSDLRVDCSHPHGVFRLWSYRHRFSSTGVSSADMRVWPLERES
ncbi:hypothetical protein [Rhodococcus sp. B10]|uniref:hypothetical protein n=1 Tax=Rhodococcus sp. B10 TaxID=2695876 RepID=UPI00143223AA|nr:hypothetical protein [Rhodococcus sp. B10]NIL77159.1 hypothetical protein [Rhodococcus sp. B10]